MNPLVASLVVGALAVSAVTTATLGVAAWRIRETPGAVPFLGLMVAVTVYTTGYLAGSVSSPAVRVFWEQVHWVGIAFVPVCFLAFAMDYLGHDDHLAAVVGATSVPSVGMIALVWTNGGHRLVFTGERVVDMSGLAVLSQDFGPVYWAFLVYAYALILVGSYLLVRLAVLSEYLYLDQSLSLLVGVVVPLVGNALSVFQVPAVPPVSVPGLDLTPFAFTITGVAFGNATFRYRLFDLVPATWQIGRETVVGSLDDGVVIVDTDRTVVYLNDVAADIFDATVETAVGTDIEYLVDADDVGLGTPDALGELELDSRTYEVRSNSARSTDSTR
ncbi:hypothetical protein BRD17_06130 [Halobacteriales archaeon SW_7_68_16]|nr:MAG: hypothetical protein BRD17_06130 [Halobacteriales archaeon SW_7_68_16]